MDLSGAGEGERNKNEYLYQDILREFLDSYLVQRDLEKTLSLVTEDVYSIGTGVQEIAHNKEELRSLIQEELKQVPAPIRYTLDDYGEKPISEDIFVCLCSVTTRLQSGEDRVISFQTRLTAGFRRVNGSFLAYHFHMSEASAIQQGHEFFPLHYGGEEAVGLDEKEQIGLLELMKKTLPGGAMGGYAEPGFPLYFINDELLNWLGYTYEEFIAENGQRMVNTMHPEDAGKVEKVIFESFARGDEYVVEYRMRKKDGSYIWVRDIGRKTVASGGRAALISIIVDISDERRMRQSLERTIELMKKERRRIDRMTGLLNREPAEALIGQSMIQNAAGALFLMDIDNFKLVNDVKGHPAGDQVLRCFADQLKAVFPPEAILARLGGDEFIAFLSCYKDVKQLTDLAEQILSQSVDLIADRILVKKLGISIGIALVSDDAADFGTLYSNADKAQYYVKRNGKSRYAFYGQARGLPVVRDENADMMTLRRMIQGVQADSGAFLVEYEAFNKIYQFMERNIKRMKQNTQLLLFTLRHERSALGAGSAAPGEEIPGDRRILENAIRHRLRVGDLMMDFSAHQVAVLLVNCDTENARKVAARILAVYGREAGELASEVSYETASMNEITE